MSSSDVSRDKELRGRQGAQRVWSSYRLVGLGLLLAAAPYVILRCRWVGDWSGPSSFLAAAISIGPGSLLLPALVVYLVTRGTVRRRLALGIGLASAFWLWVAAAYEGEMSAVPGLGQLKSFGELPEVRGLAATALLEPGALGIGLATAVGVVLLWVAAPRAAARVPGYVLAIVFLSCLGGLWLQEATGRRWSVGGFSRQVVYDPVDAVGRFGFVRWFGREAQRTVERSLYPLRSDVHPGNVAQALGAERLSPSSAVERWRGFNVVIVQVESLDAELIDSEFLSGVFPEPGLEEGWIANDLFFAQHSAGGSSDAELSTLVSLLPLATHGALATISSGTPRSLAQTARQAGYETAFFHSNRGSYYSRDAAHRRLGFVRRRFASWFRGAARGFHAVDRDFYAQALSEIEELSQPFFAYLVTMQCHQPYTNHSQARGEPDAGREVNGRRTPIDDLLRCQREAGLAVRDLLRGLDERRLLERTVVVLFGDHRSGVLPSAVEDFERVPLLIHLPVEGEHGAVAALEIERRLAGRPMSHLDLAPTLSDLVGFESDPLWLGVSALSGFEGVAVTNRLRLARCGRRPERIGAPQETCDVDGLLIERDDRLLPLVSYSAALGGG